MYIPDYIEQIQPNIRSYTWKRRNKTTKQRILGKKIKHKLLWNWSMHNTKENYIIHSMKSNSKIHNFQTKLVRKLAINFNRQYSYADLIQWFCSHARKNAWHTMSSLPGFHSFFLFSCPSALLPTSISIVILHPKEICEQSGSQKYLTIVCRLCRAFYW